MAKVFSSLARNVGWGAARAFLFGFVALSPNRLSAQMPQTTAPEAGMLSGEVVDALTGQPIIGANVRVIRRQTLAGGLRGESALRFRRNATTDSLGSYRLAGLPPGTYEVKAQRLGYQQVTIQVVLRESARSKVSVGLNVVPVRLEPVEMRAVRPGAYERRAITANETGRARIDASLDRQRQYVSADVREVTHADVIEAVTLAESDVFRAFQRTPGIVTRDEYSAELWVRGSRWDQTRVYFDGLPMFNPLHALGGVSGIGADAVGSVVMHPGVRPASIGEGAAAVIDVRSRSGSGDGRLRGVGELSLISARVALDQQSNDGRTAWMVAGRRSYVDWLTRMLSRTLDDASIAIPYSFRGLTARVDRRIDRLRTLEASAIIEEDAVTGDIPDYRHGNRANWGNSGGRLSLLTPIGPFMLRQSIGFTRFATDVRVTDVGPDVAEFAAETEPPMNGSVRHAMVSGVFNGTSSAQTGWMFGYDLIDERATFDGAARHVIAGDISDDDLTRDDSFRYASGWIESRNRVKNLEMQAGLRLDVSKTLLNAGAVRAAPRLNGRFHLDSSTTISAGAGRSFQYVQTTWRQDRHIQTQVLPIRLWLLSDAEVPALKTDIATLGVERWVRHGALLTATAFARRMNGVVMPDPTIGPLVERPLFVTGSERAEGIEVGLRRMSGKVTGSFSYSFAGARLRAAGLEFDSPSLRRHSVDLTAMLRATNRIQLGAAFTAASGARFTRVDRGETITSVGGDVSWFRLPRAYEPGGQRAPGPRSLDLMAQWDFGIRSFRGTLFTQLQNALGRSHDASLYLGYDPCSIINYGAGGQTVCTGRDEFARGLPRLPVIGLRAAF